ncbi:MAG: AMP-dependent synthetase/ligase, partial [Sphingobacteriaceae bacterium]
LSLGLLKLGIKKGDTVATISSNRPQWNIIDFAVMQIGGIHVPLYPTLSAADITYILNDAEIKIVFAENEALAEKINAIIIQSPSVQAVYTFELTPKYKHWQSIALLGDSSDRSLIEKYQSAVLPTDLFTLIYTSGTTGNPKGVMLSHQNLLSNLFAASPLIPPGAYRSLSFLPLSHIYERIIVYMYLSKGTNIYYAESLDKIAANFLEVKPNMFTTVPRLLEKVYDRIVEKGNGLKGIKRLLFFWALNLGLKYEYDGANGWWYEFQLKIANKIIFNKWRDAFGGNVVAAASGGAALQDRLARVFWAAKIPVLQGYGLTETSPVVTMTGIDSDKHFFGTCGPVIPGVEMKLAADGEILVRGANVMQGYYKNPAATAEVIDADGWFHTGDIGVLVQDRYLKITDRKKEIFKTAGGKYIAPGVMENKFKESKFIEQIVVIGENERFPAALIVPSFSFLKDWCKLKKLDYTSDQEMVQHPVIVERIQKEVDKYNLGFGNWEKIKKFELLPKEFSIDAGEMTPKLSLKRKVILQKHEALILKIYDYKNTSL